MPTLVENLVDALDLIGGENILHAAVYPFRKACAEAAWTRKGRPRHAPASWGHFLRNLMDPVPHWPRSWAPLTGAVTTTAHTARGARIQTAHGTIIVDFLAPDLVRVRHLPATGDTPPPPPYALAQPATAWSQPEVTYVEAEDAVLLTTGELTVGVRRADGGVFVADGERRLLRADVDVAQGADGAVRHRVALTEGERVFGLGERATVMNHRGHTRVLWNRDPGGYETGDDPINLAVPVYVGVVPRADAPPATYLVFYENAHYGEFDLGERLPNVAEHRFAGGELRYYLTAGPAPQLLERYTALTGRHALPPLWLLGYHQSRWSYVPEARVRELARDFQEHRVPCDAIYLDIDYMDGFRCFTWDQDLFSNLPKLANDLREQGIKLVTMIDPGIKGDPDYAVYREGVERRYFCSLPNGRTFHAPVWPGPSAFPDFTDPEVRAWWGEQYRELVEAGVAGFWNDMNEPSAFAASGDPTLPATLRHALEGKGAAHAEAHNVYGMQMVRATGEGLERLMPERRPVVITRSGWAGVQRHAISWTGDNQSTWDSLRLTIPMIMGLGLSGVPFTGADVGGFSGEADGELFTRWLQMAAFMPFFRAHTAGNTPDQEPWSYGEPFLSINRRFIELRYELLPYLYTATWQLATRGWPMVRPLWWDDGADPALWDVDDAFLCGDALLVAPVVEPGATAREVRLPAGAWYDYWTNQRRGGGTSFEQVAPLETLPLFVRAGTVLPLGEVGSSVEQRRQKFLRLHVYPPTEAGEARSWLYEDAGEGFDYREGKYRVSCFLQRRTPDRLEIGWGRTGIFAPPYEHVALTLQGVDRAPRQVRADGEAYPVVKVDPVRRTALLGVPPFKHLEIIL